MKIKSFYCISILFFLVSTVVNAHHVLGRPSYSLTEDSNTPPSLQIDTQIGKYFVTYMAFPAFPKPNEAGRVNLYIRKIKDDTPFTGQVSFHVKDDSWFFARNKKSERIGIQTAADNIFRQGFVFKREGNFIISARFEADGEPYIVDFPLQIGSPWPIGILSTMLIAFIVMLLIIKLMIREKLVRIQVKQHQQEAKI